MRSQHIRALTGVRFFAALWVVVYHSTRHNQALLVEHHTQAHYLVYPFTSAGVRGVDLFFILSGLRAGAELHGPDGGTTRGTHCLAVPVAATRQDLAALHARHRGRRPAAVRPLRALGQRGHGPRDLDQPAAPGADGPAVVPARTRAEQLGRPGLVTVRRVAGVPALPGRSCSSSHVPIAGCGPAHCWCWPASPWCRWWSAPRCAETWAATCGSCASCVSS